MQRGSYFIYTALYIILYILYSWPRQFRQCFQKRTDKYKKKKKMLSGTIWCEAKIHPSAHCPPELGRSTASTGRSIAWKVIVVSWTEGISLEPVDSIYLHVALVNFTIYYSQININFLFSSLSFLPCTKIHGQWQTFLLFIGPLGFGSLTLSTKQNLISLILENEVGIGLAW